MKRKSIILLIVVIGFTLSPNALIFSNTSFINTYATQITRELSEQSGVFEKQEVTTGSAIDIEIPEEIPSTYEEVERFEGEVQIDGQFNDWVDKPYIEDYDDDDGSQYRISAIRYFVDDAYLYMYVERPASSGYNTYELQTIIFNGSGPKTSIWVPWLNKENPWSWNTMEGTAITVQVEKVGGSSPGLVKVKGPGIYETTYSAGDHETKMEFRIPLSSLGLHGGRSEILFNVKADVRQDAPKQDWVNDDGPIYTGNGSTLGPYAGVLIGILVLTVGIGYRRKKIKL